MTLYLNTPSTITEKGTLLLLKQGDRKALGILFKNYSGKVYNTLKNLLHDPYLAEDLVQDLFITVWEKRSNIDPERCFEAYLMTIARHLAYNELKEKIRQAQQNFDLDQVDSLLAFSEEEELEARSIKEYILKVVEKFPKIRKEVFLMSRFQNLSHAEIAQRLNISERTVEAHCYKALQELRSTLGHKLLLLLLLLLRN